MGPMALHNKDTSFFDSRGTEAEDSEQEGMLAGDEEGGKMAAGELWPMAIGEFELSSR